LSLSGNWRKTDVSWRDALTGIRPGAHVRPISDGERRQKNISPTGMALGVRYVQGKAAQVAGLRQGDVILAVDGETGLKGEGDFLEFLRLVKAGASHLALRVHRRGEELDLKLPLE
jgi:S1-C subfamily serine protease